MAENTAHLDTIRTGYTFDGATLTLGAAVVDGQVAPASAAQILTAVAGDHVVMVSFTGQPQAAERQFTLMAEEMLAAALQAPTAG